MLAGRGWWRRPPFLPAARSRLPAVPVPDHVRRPRSGPRARRRRDLPAVVPGLAAGHRLRPALRRPGRGNHGARSRVAGNLPPLWARLSCSTRPTSPSGWYPLDEPSCSSSRTRPRSSTTTARPSDSEHLEIAVPSVIRLRYFVRVPYQRRAPLSRRAVFLRDGGRCQYCGDKAESIDHVIPRSRGGEHTWENVVAACERCNSSKRDRFLEDTTMRLRHRPAGAPSTSTGWSCRSATCPSTGSSTSGRRPDLGGSAIVG